MIGLTLGNRYSIIEMIGVGGMAVVYKAKDTLLNRFVAVKVLKNEFMDDDEFLKKFAMEAQSAASLSHQNIVSVYDVGSSTIEGKKYNYIVMEYIDGETLKDVINRDSPLNPNYISNIGFQIASAIEAAHKNGVIHRDIKPQNILINKDDVAKVTDFGIARISSTATITYTSTVLGTVHYISPEQAKGKFIDEKSDIYSLGVVLYEMATGKVPFDAENAVGIALKHIQDPLVEPISINPDIPQGLNDIIIKSMDKNPKNRFESATELKFALLNYRNFKLDSNNEEFDKTERIGVIKEKDIADENDKAIYTMPKDEEIEEKENKSIFKTYVLPILLAFIVMTSGVLIYNFISKNRLDSEVIKTPTLLTMTEENARETIEELNFDLELEVIGEEFIEGFEIGQIGKQNPKENTDIKRGTTIQVVISTGEELVPVPHVVGASRDSARRDIIDGRLKPIIEDGYSETVPEGVVVSQNPTSDAIVSVGDSVTIVVSKGPMPENPIMPDLRNLTVTNAISIINSINLRYKLVKEYNDTVEEGYVISQSIRPDTEVREGDTVTLVVSLGVKEKPTEPIDNGENDNSGNLVTHNFTINLNYVKGSDPNFDVRIEDSKEKIIYNKVHLRADGNVSIPLKVRQGEKYTIFVDDGYYKTDTVQ